MFYYLSLFAMVAGGLTFLKYSYFVLSGLYFVELKYAYTGYTQVIKMIVGLLLIYIPAIISIYFGYHGFSRGNVWGWMGWCAVLSMPISIMFMVLLRIIIDMKKPVHQENIINIKM